jgi:hypothetical protein
VYDKNKMSPCRFCGGHHRHRDCTSHADRDSREPSGVILGITAVEPEEPDHFGFFSLIIIIISMIAAIFWTCASSIIRITGTNFSSKRSANSTRVVEGVSHSSAKSLTPELRRISTSPNNFFVDSGASDHICHNEAMFTTLDKTIHKVFRVVHRDNVTGSGMGTVDLFVRTAEGQTKLTLLGVHFVPNQTMSVISVSKTIASAGFESPDFKNLTWKANDTCNLKMIKTPEGAYVLDSFEGTYVSNRSAKSSIRKQY